MWQWDVHIYHIIQDTCTVETMQKQLHLPGPNLHYTMLDEENAREIIAMKDISTRIIPWQLRRECLFVFLVEWPLALYPAFTHEK